MNSPYLMNKLYLKVNSREVLRKAHGSSCPLFSNCELLHWLVETGSFVSIYTDKWLLPYDLYPSPEEKCASLILGKMSPLAGTPQNFLIKKYNNNMNSSYIGLKKCIRTRIQWYHLFWYSGLWPSMIWLQSFLSFSSKTSYTFPCIENFSKW